MKKIAVIPLRKGSKSIKNKNKKRMLGRPLFSWVLGEAIFSDLDEIYIFTDDEDIIEYTKSEYLWTKKVKVLKRSPEGATDTASTEYALMEFTKKIDYNYDLLMLLQATSPLTTRYDINNAIDMLLKNHFDSVLSVVETKRFFWKENGTPINYDYKKRPRRQDFNGMLVENGAIYLTTRRQFEKSGIRIGGQIGLLKMKEDTLYEIDEPEDWNIVENLLKSRLKENKKNISKIKTIVLDVDGIFTNAKVYYNKSGEYLKKFSLRDGMGLSLLKENNINIIILTSENSDIVMSRMSKLNIRDVYMGVKDKYLKLEFVLKEKNTARYEVAYLGDDINDWANIISCGWSICPIDSINEIKNDTDIILPGKGGEHFIREAVSFILKYNERFKGGRS